LEQELFDPDAAGVIGGTRKAVTAGSGAFAILDSFVTPVCDACSDSGFRQLA
jgi:hypothetical protein